MLGFFPRQTKIFVDINICLGVFIDALSIATKHNYQIRMEPCNEILFSNKIVSIINITACVNLKTCQKEERREKKKEKKRAGEDYLLFG